MFDINRMLMNYLHIVFCFINIVCSIPIDTRRRFNEIVRRRYDIVRRRMDVETTSCIYEDICWGV